MRHAEIVPEGPKLHTLLLVHGQEESQRLAEQLKQPAKLRRVHIRAFHL